MKKILFSSILFFVGVFNMYAQPDFQKINDAFKKADLTTLSIYFDANLEVSIFDKDDSYSKAAAIQLLNTFFEKEKPTNATLMHKGSNGNGVFYAISNMTTREKTYRIYVYFQQKNNTHLIQEIRIDNIEK